MIGLQITESASNLAANLIWKQWHEDGFKRILYLSLSSIFKADSHE